ncbi:Glucoamylase (glucan-1,4-alpha-glucosidase), GH15 family [Micromonospora rhizosphaerae]|uniref:Glucoamylase (Glucan-1,4-alpha-glucosidase), GH15 family n=1 Tax=Micromonospora rhizosphaerae TaxID=568872 RepID=A0A1C6RHZ9_9ACTN|nr:glycoside hydrolase family 15 protein [Micromonospora rhizosphaerae]SCL16735.1 Glucoamylase (glucan-1,4-alpha-glucosidase), GH15 family [Micromonospora rhizosphaerae]
MSNERIGEHGFLADGLTAALVSRDGSVDWWCPARFDGPSVFARLLDDDGGHWFVRPGDQFDADRSYLGDTLVLRTVFTTQQGTVALTDALALEPGARVHIGLRPPRVLLRMVEGLSGRVPVVMSFAPRFEYGRVTAYLAQHDSGVAVTAGPTTLTMSASVPLECRDGDASAQVTVGEGQRETFALAYTPTYGGGQPPMTDVGAALADTIEAWESWSRAHNYPGRYPELVRRSALVVQGLTYQPSGAVVAAATTSLPEKLGSDRNYDYRYTWVRDFALTLRALKVAACPYEAGRLFTRVAQAVGQPGNQPTPIMYDVEGERDLTERKLETLRGYGGSGPVWVGNDAWRQRQLDVPGEVLDAAWTLRNQLDPMPADVRQLLAALADTAARDWSQPDAGMWEARDVERHHVSSKVLCWVALDRAVRFGTALGSPEDLARWASARDEVRAAVLQQGWRAEVGAYTGAFGSDELDACVLIMPLVGFLPATDERMRATIELIEQRLSSGGLVRRWPGDPAGFLLASFWLVQCLALVGEGERAIAMFEGLAGRASDLGLFAEQIDPRTGEQLGNFPQAFSHIALIDAAWLLTNTTCPPE